MDKQVQEVYPLNKMWEIAFDALENPPWRTQEGEEQDATVEGMISDIMTYHKRWREEEHKYDKEMVEEVKDKFFLEFITHVNKEEEHGFSTLEETTNVLRNRPSKRTQSIEENETVNLEKAYLYLPQKVKNEERPSDYGLLEASLLEETHRIILQDIPFPKRKTKPGVMSSEDRETDFNGETYKYQKPEDMKIAVNTLLDQYNYLFKRCTEHGLEKYDDYYNLFKLNAWLLFELLDLHPFSDGNGRLCRILSSYSLSSFTPFPTPIYNLWSKSSKDDYRQALVDARKEDNRQPRALATMIIECSYYGWRNFFKELGKRRNSENTAFENVSTDTDKKE